MRRATLISLCVCFVYSHYIDNYDNTRLRILEEEMSIAVGGQLELTETEAVANDTIMHWKYQEIDEGFDNPHYFNFSRSYFSYKHQIERSKVYQIIRQMPKGAALHVHSSLILGSEYLLNLTYHDNLHVCFEYGDFKFSFSDTTPELNCSSGWQLMNETRYAHEHVDKFDRDIKSRLSLHGADSSDIVTDINTIWDRFNKVYRRTRGLVKCRPIHEQYFYDALQKFYDDNVMYVEIRSGLHGLYELNGTVNDRMFTAELYQRVADQFVKDHPDFIGVKLILTHRRVKSVNEIRQALELAKRLKKELPNFFAGFDLVGQEDLGRPLKDFLPVLAESKDDLNYYFHAGETNWYGTTSDENLLDAVLLGAKRIGHGYALLKHPALMAAVKNNNIALEVNVVSNNVLSLVRDVRNHPLAAFLAQNLPVVLSSDDPGMWDSEPMSYDFYVAFVGVASRRADLRTLKQLALNSLHYSALSSAQKLTALRIFHAKWDIFVRNVVKNSIDL